MPKSDPAVVINLRQFRAALLAREDAQLQLMADRWVELERSMHLYIEDFAFLLAQARENGSIVTEQLVWDMRRYQELDARLREQITRYVDRVALPDVLAEQRTYAMLGLQSAQTAITASYPELLAVNFYKLPVHAIEAYVGMLVDGAPLRDLLMKAYPDAAGAIMSALIDGIAKGLNPVTIAEIAAQGMSEKALERLTLIARTEQLRAWRMASTQQYRDSGVVKGFKRLVAKDDRTCAACLVSDGEEYDLENELADHPRGRCTVVPICKHAPAPEWETGSEWLEGLSEERQRDILGDSYFELWQSGQIELGDLRSTVHSDIWGDSPAVTPLSQLIH